MLLLRESSESPDPVQQQQAVAVTDSLFSIGTAEFLSPLRGGAGGGRGGAFPSLRNGLELLVQLVLDSEPVAEGGAGPQARINTKVRLAQPLA